MPRIALIHALVESVAPIEAEFVRSWAEAQRMNLLDDSLSADLARKGALDTAMTVRFLHLADYAVATGADAILFTCSAFGPCIDAVKQRHGALPVLKPNEAMVAEAEAAAREGASIGLVASFAPTLQSMPREFAAELKPDVQFAEGALAALQRGDAAAHDAAAAEASEQLAARGCTVIALAQFSLARAAPAVAARTGLPVLTTPASALRRLRQRLG
jgi:Asp/Glu/hydantoin racemase